MSEIKESEQEIQAVNIDQETLDFRSVSAPLNHIRRKDLDKEIKDVFNKKKINAVLYSTSDYILEYQLLIQSTMSNIKKISFVDDGNGGIDLKRSLGFKTIDIFPRGFQLRENIKLSSTAISREVLDDEKLSGELNMLFTMQHLQRIDSAFFGIQGTRALDRYQLQDKLNKTISDVLPSLIFYYFL